MFGLKRNGIQSQNEFVKNLPIPAFVVDSQGRMTFGNDQFAELTGCNVNTMTGKKAWSAFSDNQTITPVERMISSGREEIDDEFLLRNHQTGKKHAIHFAAVPYLNKKNELEGGIVTLSHRVESAENNQAVADLHRIPTPVMRIDKNFTVEFLNQAGANILGKTPDQVIGMKCYELFKTPHCNTSECRCAQSMNMDAVRTGETIADPNGLNMPISYTCAPVKDENGNIQGALEYVTDISHTKAIMAEAQIKVDYLNNIPTPVMVIDRAFSITYMNHAGADVLGMTPDTVKGKKCYDLFKTPHCNTPDCRCDQAMRHDDVRSGETIADPNGLNLPISYTGTPVKDSNGQIIGALEYVTDITETKTAMEDARMKVSYLDNIPTPVMAIDRDFTIAYMNPAGAKVLGKTPETVKGHKCYDLFKTPHCNTGDCRCAQAMERDGIFTGETVADPRNLNMPIEYTGTPLKDKDGRIIGALEYVVNITERKEVLKDIIAVVDALSNNNLTIKATGKYEGDFLAIAEALNKGVDAQHNAMIQVADAVEQISSASEQIASSSQQVAEGASEQASALEQTSSSLEEMAGMTKQNADNTVQAQGLSESTREAANKGSQAMTNMTTAMGKIKSAAEATAEIIKDINEIAFQTNLLALNAAVEAARAGDAGRGFAVVAEEVRNLAGRAKDAAKNTEELIKQSVSLADEGEKISENVDTTLTEVVHSVDKVTNIVGEITVASQEQARGIDQINKAVTEMDKVVQTAAANSEESSSAAQELSSQSQELAAMVGRFELHRAARKNTPIRRTSPRITTTSPIMKSHPNPTVNQELVNPSMIIPLEDDPDFSEF